MIKAGAQRLAAELGLMLVAPDTSPRQPRLPGDDASWDFGLAAGFYVDATVAPWSSHYQMYSYVTSELPALVNENFPALAERQSIFGHSMGGHGALVCALRNPERYRSVSAFAPISAPMRCPWGQKAFAGYLGSTRHLGGLRREPARLTRRVSLSDPDRPGHGGQISAGAAAARAVRRSVREGGTTVELRMRAGYDHGYYFIQTFMADHLAWHAAPAAEQKSVRDR